MHNKIIGRNPLASRPNNTVVDLQHSLGALLEQAGFDVRGRRATCRYCTGSSRLTVGFNDEQWHCFRCNRKGNVRTLARNLGLPLAPLTPEIVEKRDRVAEFTQWGNICHLILVRRWRALTQRAELAKRILGRFPDCEPAWGALADFYHSEASFGAAFEFLACEKLPIYLEVPMTKEKLFAAFSETQKGVSHAA